MKDTGELIDDLQPVSVEPWDGRVDVDVPYIPGLAIERGSYAYVSQGHNRTVSPDDSISAVATDGISLCSGFVLFSPDTQQYEFAHLEPFSEDILRRLEQTKADGARQAVLVYGDQSKPQFDVENLIHKGYFGPINLRHIRVDGGGTGWGMVLYPQTGEIKTFSTRPEQQIATFEVFSPEQNA